MDKDERPENEPLVHGIAVPGFNYGDDDKLKMKVAAKAKASLNALQSAWKAL